MARGGPSLPIVSPGPTMTYHSTPCGKATPKMALCPIQGWPACKAVDLRPSSIPFDTPRRTILFVKENAGRFAAEGAAGRGAGEGSRGSASSFPVFSFLFLSTSKKDETDFILSTGSIFWFVMKRRGEEGEEEEEEKQEEKNDEKKEVVALVEEG
jgi:hypothetical protein